MPPSLSEGLDAISILLGVVGVLSTVTAFFLARFVNQHDERDKKITEALNGILTRLAVHDEKHGSHEERLDELEARRKKS